MGAAAPIIIGGTQAAISLYGAYAQSKAAKEQAKAEQQLLEGNARLAELEAEDAIIRGKMEENQVRKRARFVKGAQRAAFAGQNIAVGTGTAAAIAAETDRQAETDALTVSNNAFREAWGYRTEASQLRSEGRIRRAAAKVERFNTLLAGGLNAANSLGQGFYMSGKQKSTGFNPRNPTEARFDREYRSGR